MALNLSESEKNGAWVIHAEGEVDLYSSPPLREAILRGMEAGHTVLAVDLAGVPYMDSSGVATLVEGLKAGGKAGKTFVLLAPSQSVMKVLQLSRLDTLFDIRESL